LVSTAREQIEPASMASIVEETTSSVDRILFCEDHGMGLTDFIYTNATRLRLVPNPLELVGRYLVEPSHISSEEKSKTDMHRAFYGNEYGKANKWLHYLSVYDRHLSRFRGTPVRLLEIGVSAGGSLSMWRDYLGPDATIFGVDINPNCRKFDGVYAQVRIGSQADPNFLKGVCDEMGGVDVVIDDGSHVATHQRVSFETLFPVLSDRGVYICEDTHTAYWRGWAKGGYRRRTNFIEQAKRVVDDMHSDFHRCKQGVENAHRAISGVHFYNSMVVIEKEPQSPPRHVYVP
jgi:hypothetical protein